jgi:hypothetical protein
MSSKKVADLPMRTEFTLRSVEEGVVVIPRGIKDEEFVSEEYTGVVILQTPTRYRNQDCYVAKLFRQNAELQTRSISSQRFSRKGDPNLRADAFYKVLGAAVASAL